MRLGKTFILLILTLAAIVPIQMALGASITITNPGAETGDLTGWTYSGAVPWTVETDDPHSGTYAFVGSNLTSNFLQRIDLLAAGFSQAQLDTFTNMQVQVWVQEYPDGQAAEDTYDLLFAIEGEGQGTIAYTYQGEADAPSDWTQVSLDLGNYGAGMRYARIELWSTDGAGTEGMQGAMFDDVTLTITGESTAPTLSSTSPTDGATGVARNPELTLNFSENVYVGSGDITILKTSNGQAVSTIDITSDAVQGSGTDTITVTLPDFLLKGTDYYVTIDDGALEDAWENTFAGISSSSTWNFRTASGTTFIPAKTFDYTIANVQSQIDNAGTAHLSWLAGADVTYVQIFVAADGKEPMLISDFVQQTADWEWKIPAEYRGQELIFSVTSTDLAEKLYSSTSPPVVWQQKTVQSVQKTVELSTLPVGSYIRTAHLDTVYYIDLEGRRRPIPDAQTFFTWETSFDIVQNVDIETLALIPLGPPLAPKPGTVLVKIQSVPKVFAISGTPEHPELRWITSEATAAALYGDAWADYVIDIPPTMWPRFSLGQDIETANDFQVDHTKMLQRAWLNFID